MALLAAPKSGSQTALYVATADIDIPVTTRRFVEHSLLIAIP